MMPENNFISAVRGYLRLGNFPLDASSVFESFSEANIYADTNPTAYLGQIIAVANNQNETVTIYQVGYKSGGGLEIQSLVADATGNVRSINNILPDVNGNITLDLEHLDLILTFLEDTENEVVFSKPISIDKILINSDSHVINKAYLEARVDSITVGMVRTLKTEFSTSSATTTETIPGGATIKKAFVRIIDAYEGFLANEGIRIVINNKELFSRNDIYETEEGGVFLVEPMVRLDGTAANKYSVIVEINGTPIAGSAELQIDFNIDYID
jgi:hypothetical protein